MRTFRTSRQLDAGAEKTDEQLKREEVVELIKKHYERLFISEPSEEVDEEATLTTALVRKLQSDPGRLFDHFGRAIVTATQAEDVRTPRAERRTSRTGCNRFDAMPSGPHTHHADGVAAAASDCA